MQSTPEDTTSNKSLSARLRDALRIAFLRPVPAARLSPTWPEIAAAAVLTLCVPTFYSAWSLGSDGMWAANVLPQALFHVIAALATAIVLASILRRPEGVPTLVFASLLAWLVIDTATLALWSVVSHAGERRDRGVEWAFYYLPFAWLALAVARFALPPGPLPAFRRIAIVFATLLFLAFPLAYLHPERSLWVKDWSRDAAMAEQRSARQAASGEDVFYRQPELLARELAAVQPGIPGRIDVFFVGMAGYGGQDVFMREVDAVGALMRDRFGADGHIVKLVNNPRTALSAPIASTTSLRAALRRIAQSMDIDEDVLVLFLTSHGSAEHRFSLELWPLQFHELNPDMLRRILDESGIRNRVVVISACYAGGFVDKLKGDHTLVITAAAFDRNSFGCGNENDWTYFGKAYFDEALRKTHSFTHAFELAKPVIEEREKAEKFDPSNPQMVVGEAIKGRLDALAAQLGDKN